MSGINIAKLKKLAFKQGGGGKKRNCRFGYGAKGGCKKNPANKVAHASGPNRKGYVEHKWITGLGGGLYYINKNGKRTYKK